MLLKPDPRKKAQKIIVRLKKGQGSPDAVNSLLRSMSGDKDLTWEIVQDIKAALTDIPPENSLYLLQAVRIITEAAPNLTIDAVPSILRCLDETGDKQQERDISLEAIITLFYLSKENPEVIKPAIPTLLEYMDNHFDKIRVSSFCTLKSISESIPEAYTDYTAELLRALQGLNNDTRIYTAEIIGDIADTNPEVVEEAYKSLDRLLKHPNSQIRSEAGRVIKKLIMAERHTKPMEIGLADLVSEERVVFETGEASENGEVSDIGLKYSPQMFDEIETEFRANVDKFLESIGLEHLMIHEVMPEDAAVPPQYELTPPQEEVEKDDDSLNEETRNLLMKILSDLMESTVFTSAMVLSGKGKPIVEIGEADEEFVKQVINIVEFNFSMGGNRLSIDIPSGKLIATKIEDTTMIALSKPEAASGIALYEMQKATYKVKSVLSLADGP